MAAVPPAHAVLLNADLLALVVEHASKATNTAIRLCNKAMNVTASPSLFRTLLVSSRDRHLDRLEFVANHDQFRRGVREVVWETTAYSGMKGYDERDTWLLARRLKFTNCDFPDWDDGVDNGVRAKVFAMLGRMEELALDEIVRRGKAGGLPLGREPRKSFRKLKGLEHLVMTMWCGGVDGQRPFLAGDIVQGTNLPPDLLLPMVPYIDRDEIGSIQNLEVSGILKAFSSSDRKLKSFTITPSYQAMLPAKQSSDIGYHGTLMDFTNMPALCMSGATEAVRHLTKLDLDYENNYILVAHLTKCVDNSKPSGLCGFLKQLVSLQNLFVRMSCYQVHHDAGTILTAIVDLEDVFGDITFPNLRTLRLDAFWSEANELCSFIKRHQATLRHLTLANITLGGTQAEIEGHPEATPGLMTLPPQSVRIDHYTSKRDNGCILSIPPAWKQVAKMCQKLPKLKGLRLDGPSASEDWTVLSVFDVEELHEEGMNGRENRLVDTDDGGVLAHLEKTWSYSNLIRLPTIPAG